MIEKKDHAWKKILENEFKQDYFVKLNNFIEAELKNNKIIYPPKSQIFNVFKLSSFDNVKVVILGQDPYHQKDQANGLCFSVSKGIKIPPSLKNIYKELKNDLGIENTNHGDLSSWAKQGVLLLNTCLSVEKGKAGSHRKKGWEQFSDNIIKIIEKNKNNVVFILWGNFAIKKVDFVNSKKHLVLTSPHPSPLSSYRGFFNNHHFSKTNKYLKDHGKEQIDWTIS